MGHVWAVTIFIMKKEVYVETPPVFLDFSFTFLRQYLLAVQWILNQHESSINLHHWNFAVWSNFTTQVDIAGFLNSPVIYIYYSSIFKSCSTILKILQSTLKFVFISQFVFVLLSGATLNSRVTLNSNTLYMETH